MAAGKPERGTPYMIEVAKFLYGPAFWYTDPLKEIRGLDLKQLLWVPAPQSLCALWQVGHIAAREQLHVSVIMQGLPGSSLSERYRVFMDEGSVEEVRRIAEPLDYLYRWVREVREDTKRYIDSLTEEDLRASAPAGENTDASTVGHWLFITAAHTALHIGRIQMLRALIEDSRERAC